MEATESEEEIDLDDTSSEDETTARVDHASEEGRSYSDDVELSYGRQIDEPQTTNEESHDHNHEHENVDPKTISHDKDVKESDVSVKVEGDISTSVEFAVEEYPSDTEAIKLEIDEVCEDGNDVVLNGGEPDNNQNNHSDTDNISTRSAGEDIHPDDVPIVGIPENSSGKDAVNDKDLLQELYKSMDDIKSASVNAAIDDVNSVNNSTGKLPLAPAEIGSSSRGSEQLQTLNPTPTTCANSSVIQPQLVINQYILAPNIVMQGLTSNQSTVGQVVPIVNNSPFVIQGATSVKPQQNVPNPQSVLIVNASPGSGQAFTQSIINSPRSGQGIGQSVLNTPRPGQGIGQSVLNTPRPGQGIDQSVLISPRSSQ
ncbi:unnamed protein product, partial [Owenia fusiformis]